MRTTTNNKEKSFQDKIDYLVVMVNQFRQYQSDQFQQTIDTFCKKLAELNKDFLNSSSYREFATQLSSVCEIQSVLLATMSDIVEVKMAEIETLLHDKKKAHSFVEFMNELDGKIAIIKERFLKMIVLSNLQYEKHMNVIPNASSLNKYIENSRRKLNELDGLLVFLQCPEPWAKTKVAKYFNDTKEYCESLVSEVKRTYKDTEEIVVNSINRARECSERQKRIDNEVLSRENILSVEHSINFLIMKIQTLQASAFALSHIKKMEKGIAEKKLNESFEKINAILSESLSKVNDANFGKIFIDLKEITNGKLSGKLEINASDAREIYKEVQREFVSKHEAREKFDFGLTLSTLFHNHVQNRVNVLVASGKSSSHESEKSLSLGKKKVPSITKTGTAAGTMYLNDKKLKKQKEKELKKEIKALKKHGNLGYYA